MASLADKVLNEALGLPLASSGITVSISGVTTSGLLTEDTLYRVVSDVDCYINIEKDPLAATASHMRLTAEVPEMLKTGGEEKVVSVIQTDSAGTLWCTPFLRSKL